MTDEQPFMLDGIAYNVWVSKLTRKFSILDSDKTGRTQNGEMYRDIIGTFYNYSMTVEQRGDDVASMDEFWEAISQPDVSHVCVFPYGQATMTQRMYITSGEQDISTKTQGRTGWGELSVNFVAMSPRITP